MKKKKFLIPIIYGLAVIGVILAILGKFNLLIWGIILLCPLIHLFGHNHSDTKNHYHE